MKKNNTKITFASQSTFALQKKKKSKIKTLAKHSTPLRNAKNCIVTLATIYNSVNSKQKFTISNLGS